MRAARGTERSCSPVRLLHQMALASNIKVARMELSQGCPDLLHSFSAQVNYTVSYQCSLTGAVIEKNLMVRDAIRHWFEGIVYF